MIDPQSKSQERRFAHQTVSKTRAEHLEWCKQRALEYVDRGKLGDAMASMCSDLKKHPDTESHPAMALGVIMMVNGELGSEHTMREFINGFN